MDSQTLIRQQFLTYTNQANYEIYMRLSCRLQRLVYTS